MSRILPGKIQVYLKQDELGESYEAFRLMDIGDIIGVSGFVFRPGREKCRSMPTLVLLSKSLRPCRSEERTDERDAVVYDRSRIRSFATASGMWTWSSTRRGEVFRSGHALSPLRKYLDDRMLEVETPVLHRCTAVRPRVRS